MTTNLFVFPHRNFEQTHVKNIVFFLQGSEYTRSLVDKKKEGSVVSTPSPLMNVPEIIFRIDFNRFCDIDAFHQGSQWAETENPEAGAAV